MDLAEHAAGIGALADPTRRALYAFVVAQPEPVGREQASRQLRIPQHSASFHLDRLVAEGLLAVEYRRLTGRTGPGAGRPSKLYKRSERQFAASLPPRRYDLAADILAQAVTRATAAGESLDQAVVAAAHATGVQAARDTAPAGDDPLQALVSVLAGQGFEPRFEGRTIAFATCPFGRLASRHSGLVCGLNRAFVQGVADGLGQGLCAELEPGSAGCCVRTCESRPLPRDAPVAPA